MKSFFKTAHASYLIMLVAALGVGYWAHLYQPQAPGKRFGVGIETWIGNSPLYIARDKGFFVEEGIDIDVMILDGIGSRKAAYEAHELDFMPDTPGAFSILFSELKPVGRIVAALDDSVGADGILALPTVASVADLRGKRVGLQGGTSGQLLLFYVLREHALSGADIKPVELSADDAGRALLAGSLDAAVTGEPSLSEAMGSKKAKILVKSDATPGLFVDVLLVSDRTLTDKGRPLKAFMRSWYRGAEFIRNDPAEAEAIIAKALGVTTDEVRRRLTTTRFYSPDESAQYLRISFPGVMRDASELYLTNKVVKRASDLPLIDHALLSPNSKH
jgi:NitT/TauT family transport system substrate-binding protein